METRILDFSDQRAAAGWEAINDAVMGGHSEGLALWEGGVLVFKGNISFEDRGGFASIRSGPLLPLHADVAGFELRIRGDGKTYKFTVRADRSFDGISYQTVFTTKAGEQQTVRFPLSGFLPTYHGRQVEAPPLVPGEICRLGFIIGNRQEGPFRMEILSVGTYGG